MLIWGIYMTFISAHLNIMFDINMLLDSLDNNQHVCLSHPPFPSHNAGFCTSTFWGLVLLAGGIFWRKNLFQKTFWMEDQLKIFPLMEVVVLVACR
jgi:hypothetical protein